MIEKSVLLADDIANTSEEGRSRSHILRAIAAEISQRLKLPLRVIFVENLEGRLFRRPVVEEVKAKDKESMGLLEVDMAHYPVKSKIFLKEGDPVTHILSEEKIDDLLEMIVMGSQGKHGIAKALLGSTSEEVLRRAATPILIVGPEAQRLHFEFPEEGVLRILLLTDLSSASVRAEDYAASLARKLNARLTICNSPGHEIYHLKQMLYSRNVVPTSVDSMFEEIGKDAEKLLSDKVEEYKKINADVEALFLKEEANLEDVLAKKAEGAYDLIVMGTHSRNRFLTTFLGSTARNVILKSPIPVIICRSVIRGL
ncbi:hypothetical protein AZI87_01610 [Bdellovibrio bacteriovorus]|uniref:UspA domain-containing protein n=1 Tax=Bdellovibrio bacteriovorus TaxID=959 RepID=A0A161PCY6_BDEBC|nr:universal stress protein [Bdellovibrio bacteriovorus]KYG67994.1 hypothetical protein AZI87_01610 [Bdellovibrio bacteriovorus]